MKRFLAFAMVMAMIIAGSGCGMYSAPPVVSLEEFSSLQINMTYEQAKAVIGAPGDVISENSIASIHTIMYQWQNQDLSSANAMFQNGMMVQKSQVALKPYSSSTATQAIQQKTVPVSPPVVTTAAPHPMTPPANLPEPVYEDPTVMTQAEQIAANQRAARERGAARNAEKQAEQDAINGATLGRMQENQERGQADHNRLKQR